MASRAFLLLLGIIACLTTNCVMAAVMTADTAADDPAEAPLPPLPCAPGAQAYTGPCPAAWAPLGARAYVNAGDPLRISSAGAVQAAAVDRATGP